MTPLDGMRLEPLADQPIQTDIRMVDGVFVKSIEIRQANTILPQHSHAYDHLSYVASGAVRAWADGDPLGDFVAPTGIVIKAGVKHLFQTLADATVILCIHNIRSAEAPELLEEHTVGAP